VKAGQKVSIVGKIDTSFLDNVEVDVSRRLRKGSDIVFFAANARDDLRRLAGLRAALAPAGALWVIRPKGGGAITEAETMAEKFVIPRQSIDRAPVTKTSQRFSLQFSKRGGRDFVP
jgi:hypothetical protein